MKTVSTFSPAPGARLSDHRTAPRIPWITILPGPTANDAREARLFAYCQDVCKENDYWEAVVFGSLELGALVAAGAAFLAH